jgi:sporulation protein YlmC with PRC-barrel domain
MGIQGIPPPGGESLEADNPYTFLEGYEVYDADQQKVGRIQRTVYDAPGDVLKYVVADGHPIPAEDLEVHADQEIVSVPYDRQTIETAPRLEDFSGEFDAKLHAHYGKTGRP